ncbi:MAG: MFS transporter [Lachnospiraceae bacterium]|nr:MFS transporter [Acetatifactor muris]MCM1219731.1 MFS transporter [Lachnospiraceae bacterium]
MEVNAKAKTEKQDKMPWGRFFAWKTRDVALAGVTVILSSYLLLYCANTLGLDTAVVGVLLLAARIVDAFTDVAAGFIVDSTKTRFGKARPYEIFIVLEWICMVALFFANENWSMFFKYAYVFVMYVLIFSICSTMLNAAQNPYMIRAFNGKRSIVTKVSSFGGIVTLAGSIVVSMTFPRLYNAWVVEGNGGSAAWRKLIIVYAIPLALLGIVRFLAVKEDPTIDDAEKNTQKLNLKEVFTMLRTNPYVWSFGGMIGLYNLAVGFGAGSFYFQYVVGNVNAFGAVSAFGMVLLPIMLIFPTLIRKVGMSKLFIIAAAGSVLGYVTVFFGGSSLAMVYVGIIVTNLISLPCSYLQTPGIMNIATYNEYKGMHRMDGSSAIVMNFLMKSLAGVGTGLTGVLLSMAGYISTTGSEMVVQPDSAIFMIRLLYSLIPGLCVAGIILCSLHYIKLEKQIPQIEAEIKARKEAGQK